ncbi:SRPBCC family protein [Streptomyces sp. NPDC060184]|uniref:SRPBCC family protein n=1 Tax=Streptomyces sp. NPDC060184 TaxID=3347064 RepID=UPI00365640B7
MPDAADHRPDVHRPSGFSPAHAQQFCQAQALVSAPAATAFELLADVPRWPEWVPGIGGARPGEAEHTFDVRFHEHRFEIFLGERVQPSRFGWSAVGAGVQLHQSWLLTEADHGTHVVTANVVRVPAAASPDALSPLWAQRLNTLWLAQLRRLSQSSPAQENGS